MRQSFLIVNEANNEVETIAANEVHNPNNSAQRVRDCVPKLKSRIYEIENGQLYWKFAGWHKLPISSAHQKACVYLFISMAKASLCALMRQSVSGEQLFGIHPKECRR